jgi:hypothetical protein
MKGEAKENYDAIRMDLIRVHANWQLFTKLFATSDHNYPIMNNTAPGFFKLIQDVLVDDAVVSLTRLTDRPTYVTLSRLVKNLKAQVDHEFHAELIKDLDELRAMCADIREHRNKRVVHKARMSNPPVLAGVPQRLPALTRQKIEGAMKAAAALMNKVLGHFENIEQYYDPVIATGAEPLLAYLKEGYNTSARRL